MGEQMSEDMHESVDNFHKWQNNEEEIHRAKLRTAQQRLFEAHQKTARSLDPSVLVLTSFDQRLLHGMKVAV